MKRTLEEGFLDYFKELRDPRGVRNRLYTMAEIVLTTLCAAICGADGWQDVEDYGKIKLDCLRQFLPYKNGIPSDDTFRRFFRALDPIAFQSLFREWVKTIYPVLANADVSEQVIAIDGKASRHTFDGDTKMLHMVSAYATEARLVLAQEKVSEKSNEITAIPLLLEWLDLQGSTVTIDAMGCQYKIGETIVKKAGNYIFSLKGNQGALNDDITLYFKDTPENSLNKLSYHEDCEKGHGRIETRRCWVESKVSWLRKSHEHWDTIQSIIRIESTREIKGKISTEDRYYISSLTESAEKILQKIRSHWAIENVLHWVLDMSFGEDQSRIRKGNAPQVMSIIRHMALNLLQLTKAKMKRQSVKRLRKMAGWDNGILKTILTQDFS